MNAKLLSGVLVLICSGCESVREQSPSEQVMSRCQDTRLRSALEQAIQAILSVDLYSSLYSITNGGYRWNVDLETNGDYTFAFDFSTHSPDLEVFARVSSNAVILSGDRLPHSPVTVRCIR